MDTEEDMAEVDMVMAVVMAVVTEVMVMESNNYYFSKLFIATNFVKNVFKT